MSGLPPVRGWFHGTEDSCPQAAGGYPQGGDQLWITLRDGTATVRCAACAVRTAWARYRRFAGCSSPQSRKKTNTATTVIAAPTISRLVAWIPAVKRCAVESRATG